ncbi:zinc finger protein 62 isoform X13 [Agrilus planipennis]|uniref:Zinc finger protein 62 isoform X13 n=1 Tax=Agrilus planipennis TaxID=224129 RepID=A0A1W4XH56_AGRPL|nr:zinc finger protein 62 isoform X13 [Agrilus planipennis]
MVNSVELMQLCRLCLVKDEVNIPIFDNETDVQQIFLKISTCLPVKVTQDDNLPKKICNDCSYKLDLCYQFWNTSANSEKQLVTWLNEVGLSQETLNEAKLQKTESNSTPGLVLKQETIEPESESSHEVVNNVSTESQEYILQQQQLPYQTPAFPFTDDNFVSGESANAGASKTHTNNKRESTLKRKRQAVATVTQPDSDDDVDEDIDDPTETKVAKTEETSDDDRDDDGLNDEESTEFAGVPSTSTDNEQPGPSGIGKNVVDAPFATAETALLQRLISCPSLSVTFPSINNFNFNQDDAALVDNKDMDVDEIKVEPDYFPSDTSSVSSSSSNQKRRKKTRKSQTPRKRKTKASIKKEDADDDEDDNETKRESKSIVNGIHCFSCDITFENNLSFALHSIKHNKKRYSCHMCDFSNASKYSMQVHIRMHEGETDYKCEICNKAFTNKTHAIEHKNYHTASHRRSQHWEIMTGMPLVKYDCLDCNKHYTTSTGLKRHKQKYHNERNEQAVLCDICGKRLSSTEKLKFHRRIHTGYKPHACGVCSKSFTKKEQLKEHERVHTGERPFICKFCGKGFTQRSPLRIHTRIHTGERPYICRLCNKGFISKGIMDTHMKSCADTLPIS